MLGRARILETIDAAYAKRKRGDTAALEPLWAPGATYRLVGADMLPGISAGTQPISDATVALSDIFEFHAAEQLSAIVEGNRASVHWRIEFSTGAGNFAMSEVCDLWEFDDRARVVSLVQFTDTALLRILLG